MSDEPPKRRDDSDVDEPSDLLAVEGLRPEPERSPRAIVELPRTAATRDPEENDDADADASDHGEAYDVASLPRGTQLGRYALLGKVRGQADEVVYAAYDPESDRKVSLKLFHPGGGDEGDAEARRLSIARWAQAAAKLSHPCVEQIFEAGVYGPFVFLATEFIDGIDLRHWMEARDDPFPWPEVLRVFREAGRGLAAAHAQGIVHHDFKPSKVIMGKEGRLVVVDFGLAPEVEEDEDDIEISQLRVSMEGRETAEDDALPRHASGTAAYMAPEKHLSGHGDARSDQFSFCVSLYEALYGERPFSGNRPRAIALEAAKHKIRPAPEGSTVPAWLRAVVVRGLSPRPEDRFPSMEALLRELARDPQARRRRWVWGAAAVVTLASAGGLVALQLEADRVACEDAGNDDALAEAWGAERHEALHQAFVDTDRRWAEPTWSYTESKLDAWADEWRDLSVQACRATRVWEDASERHYQLRLACLDRHLAGFEATLEVLGTVDGPMLDRTHALARDLPPPRQCTDTETLVALGLPAEEHRDEVATLHRELSGLEARLALGAPRPVLEALAAIDARAKDTGDFALVARVMLLRGQARLANDEPEAEGALHQAAAAGLRAGHPLLAAKGWMSRMDALLRRGRATEAAALGDYVEAVVTHKRLGWLRPTLEELRGHAEQLRERPAEALTHYHAALEYEELRPDADHLRLVPAWLGQSDVLIARGEHDAALPPLETALEITRNALG
ncbi:MAG: serine/threonine protein kinase, partial [Myxococcales bacterium]|nr:serine/threonine protein kinase [Myxococcales bacterium]